MLKYYELLEVSEDASEDEIKRSFKKLAFRYHPDVNPGNDEAKQKMVELLEAYDVLSDPMARKWYHLRAGSFDIISHFEEAYQNYIKARAHRFELIRQELELERNAIKEAYAKANNPLSFRLKLIFYGALIFLSIEGLIYLTTFNGPEETNFLLVILISSLLCLSFIKIANILYLQSLYNKHFDPRGKIREENVPYYMFYILVAGFVLFFLQPKEVLFLIFPSSPPPVRGQQIVEYLLSFSFMPFVKSLLPG